ncbi:MAG: YczE/YyaS/YitT family protein [Oscillospiraceae bacterium]|jgi:uncharacterized membrane protein YczE
MKKTLSISFLYRILIYCLGLLFLAFGVAISSNSQLGISPTNSLPFAISAATGVKVGTIITLEFGCYILIQMLLLKQFKPSFFIQLVFSTIFGYFVDFAKLVLGTFTLSSYLGRLLMLAVSIVLIAVGLVFYLSAELVPMPMEGMCLAINKRLPRVPFHRIKIGADSLSVALAALVSLIGTGSISVVREGTVISALLIGKVMGMLQKPLGPILRRICFGSQDNALEKAGC